MYYGVSAVLLAMLAWVYRTKRDTDAILWATPTFYVLLVASRYYWSVLACLPFLNQGKGSGRPDTAGSVVGLVAFTGYYLLGQRFSSFYAKYSVFNLVLLVLFSGWMIYEIVRARGTRLSPGDQPDSLPT